MLVFLSIAGEPLRAKVCGPYTIDKKVSDKEYIVCTIDMGKTKTMCRVNTLKNHHVRDDIKPVYSQNAVTKDTCDESENLGDDFVWKVVVVISGLRMPTYLVILSLRCPTFSKIRRVYILIVTMCSIVEDLLMIFHVL